MEFLALILILFLVIWLEQMVFSRHSLENLDYCCVLSTEEAEEGEEIELIETISNRKWLPVPWLKSEITTSKWLDFAGAQSIVTDKTRFVPSFFMIKSFQKVERKWHVKCLKRGEFNIQRVGLVSTDILGHMSLSRAVEVDSQVMVLPKGIDLETLFISPKYLNGDVVVRKNLLTDPFYRAGVREYVPGDSFHQIHWTATAREGNLMVHQNDFTASQSLTVVLNMQSRPFENAEVTDAETVENCIRVCASIFENTVAEQIPVRFMCNASTNQQRISTASGEYFGAQHVHELRRTLAKLQLRSTDDFVVYLNERFADIHTSDAVLVTPYINEGICDFVRAKQLQGTKVKLFVVGRSNSSDLPADCEVYCMAELFQNDEEVAM